VTRLEVPDRLGRCANVVLNLPTLSDYLHHNPHFGTIVGRYANRIARGRLALDGSEYQLAVNDGLHSLHGGSHGFGAKFWDAEAAQDSHTGDMTLTLRYTSRHGEEGYPGEVACIVRYTVRGAANEWQIDYYAESDRPTVINLSHHDYFNLAGSGSILDHRLLICASRYTPVDAGLIPIGIEAVAGTPFDFRTPVVIGSRIRESHEQLLRARGYDHNWVIDDSDDALAFAARLEHTASGRLLEIHTTEPGLQFYSGNFLDGTLAGADGTVWRQSDGLCLETQHYPDSPNRREFPSTALRPGNRYHSCTVHTFSTF
jgi:aldose 1-epimerase